MLWLSPFQIAPGLTFSPLTLALDVWMQGSKVMMDALHRQAEASHESWQRLAEPAGAGPQAGRSWYRKPIDTPAQIWGDAATQMAQLASPFGRFAQPTAVFAPWSSLGQSFTQAFAASARPAMPAAMPNPFAMFAQTCAAAMPPFGGAMMGAPAASREPSSPFAGMSLLTGQGMPGGPMAVAIAPWLGALAAFAPENRSPAPADAPRGMAASAQTTANGTALEITADPKPPGGRDFSAYRSEGGHAVAQIVFPDQTKVTLALPVSALALAPAAASLLPMLLPWLAATQQHLRA